MISFPLPCEPTEILLHAFRVLSSTESVPEVPENSPSVNSHARAVVAVVIWALPPLSIYAGITKAGTPLVQFDGSNQSPGPDELARVQYVERSLRHNASPRLPGEARSAKAVMARRIAFVVSGRGVCEVDFVFMVITSGSVCFLELFCRLPVLLDPRRECPAFP